MNCLGLSVTDPIFLIVVAMQDAIYPNPFKIIKYNKNNIFMEIFDRL